MVTTCGIYLYNILQKKILVCHATHASWKQWSIPKGIKDDDEDLWQVAVRELREETGIDINTLNVLAIHPLPAIQYRKQNKVLESFLVIIDTDLSSHSFFSNVSKDSISEVDAWRWISIAQAYTWLHEPQQENLKVIKKIV
jgi:8-oxo-dGTP pyrophosphatase MutT (NUDIX family)